MGQATTRAASDTGAVADSSIGSAWALLCRLGAVAALTSAVLIPIQVAVFLAWPPPLDGTAADWFTLLQDRRVVGLIDLDLLLVGDMVLLIPVLLAFYVVLGQTHPSLVAVAVALGFTSVAMYVASNPAVAMAALSDRYAAATTDAARSTALAAGEATLATWLGTAFHTGYLLGSVSGLIIGIVMLRGSVFGKPTAYLAIAANAIALGLYVPAVGLFLAIFSVVFLEAWYVLIGRAASPTRASGGTTSRSTRSPLSHSAVIRLMAWLVK